MILLDEDAAYRVKIPQPNLVSLIDIRTTFIGVR